MDVRSTQTASVTPSANALVFLFITARDGQLVNPTISGLGLTWELIENPRASLARVTFLFAAQAGPAPQSGSISIVFGPGPTNADINWMVYEQTTYAVATTLPQIVRAAGYSGGDEFRSSFAAFIQKFADPVNNLALGHWFIGNKVTPIPGAGWATLALLSAPGMTTYIQHRTGEGTMFDCSWGNDPSHLGGVIGLEIRMPGSPAFPALRPEHVQRLTNGGDSSSGGLLNTNTISPLPNELICVAIDSGRTLGAQAPLSVIGNGITYTKVTDVFYSTVSSPIRCMSLWVGSAVNPTSGTIQITWPNTQTQTRRYTIFSVRDKWNFSAGAVGAIVQTATARGDTVTSLTANLLAFEQPSNATFAFLAPSQNYPTPELGYQWVEGPDITENLTMQGIWRATNEQSPSMTIAAAANAAMIAFELDVPAEAPPPPVNRQKLFPAADDSNPDGWATELAGTTNIYQSIDEVVPDPSDYITTNR